MNTSLIVALLVPWLFWGVLIGLLIAAGRSWINVLAVPAGITGVVLAVAGFSSDRSAFWFSPILHLFLLVFFLGSYLVFMRREQKKE